MIYDCFLFNNELEILDIRLNTLNSVVDKVVLVEATVSHACKPKRLYFDENKNLFKEFKDKIIHIIIDDTPKVNLPWIVNDFNFSQMKRGLKKCKPNDVILFGDLDEIPSPNAVNKWKDKTGKLKVFEQTLCEYYLNYADTEKKWYGTHMASYKNLITFASLWVAKYSKPDVIIPDGGWHFTHMGDIKRIQQKLASTTHQELNNNRFNTPEHIKKSMLRGKDFLNNNFKLKIQKDSFLPTYVVLNKNRFKNFLIERETKGFTTEIYLFFLTMKQYPRIIARKILKK